MTDQRFNQILRDAQADVQRDNEVKTQEQKAKEDEWKARSDKLQELFMGRLLEAQDAMKDEISIQINTNGLKEGASSYRDPSISFSMKSPHNIPDSDKISSKVYFFTMAPGHNVRIYENATVKNNLNDAAGVGQGLDSHQIVDRILKMAAKDYFSRVSFFKALKE